MEDNTGLLNFLLRVLTVDLLAGSYVEFLSTVELSITFVLTFSFKAFLVLFCLTDSLIELIAGLLSFFWFPKTVGFWVEVFKLLSFFTFFGVRFSFVDFLVILFSVELLIEFLGRLGFTFSFENFPVLLCLEVNVELSGFFLGAITAGFLIELFVKLPRTVKFVFTFGAHFKWTDPFSFSDSSTRALDLVVRDWVSISDSLSGEKEVWNLKICSLQRCNT